MELQQQICGKPRRTEPASATITLTQFDQRHYRELIKARGETIRRVVGEVKRVVEVSTVLDAGCGIGFFSESLRGMRVERGRIRRARRERSRSASTISRDSV